MWDTEWESATENSDPNYGQTLCHTRVAKPRHHCICFNLSLGWPHEMYETKKEVGSGLVAKVKKAWKDDGVTGKLWKDIAFLWGCQYSLAHYHYNS